MSIYSEALKEVAAANEAKKREKDADAIRIAKVQERLEKSLVILRPVLDVTASEMIEDGNIATVQPSNSRDQAKLALAFQLKLFNRPQQSAWPKFKFEVVIDADNSLSIQLLSNGRSFPIRRVGDTTSPSYHVIIEKELRSFLTVALQSRDEQEQNSF